MWLIGTVIKRLWPLFKPLEKRLLSELETHFNAPAWNLFKRQVELINRVYRHANYQQVSCYCIKRGVPYHEPGLQFPARDPDLKFATIKFSATSSRKVWTADFHMVDGYFFSITIIPSPRAILRSDQIQVEGGTIHHDPMRELPR